MDEQKKAAFEAKLAEMGLVKKESIKIEDLSVEAKAELVLELRAQLKQAKLDKNEKLSKKLRRILRKKLDHKVSLYREVTS